MSSYFSIYREFQDGSTVLVGGMTNLEDAEAWATEVYMKNLACPNAHVFDQSMRLVYSARGYKGEDVGVDWRAEGF
jgi:hypothetical protein